MNKHRGHDAHPLPKDQDVPSVSTAAGVRDLIFIATTTNMVYAYDANDYSMVFIASYGTPVRSTDLNPERGYHDFADCDIGAARGPFAGRLQ